MASKSNFDAARAGTGTKEWSEHSENIQRGCSHGCLYCYASTNAVRFKLRAPGDWRREELTKKATITRYPKRTGVIMFPTAHDITPFNLEASVRVLILMLQAGNQVLIVSKPHPECIARLVAVLQPYREQILFRFTIGTTNPQVSAFWEPGAPTPAERLESLRIAHAAGFRTSISAEPLLGGIETARAVLAAVAPFVTDTVWIGKLNKAKQRVDLSIPDAESRIAEIEALQGDDAVLAMVSELQGHPLVRWKDSVNEAVWRARGPAGLAAPSNS